MKRNPLKNRLIPIFRFCKKTEQTLSYFSVLGLTFLITIYKKCISPALGPKCRFYPSCSEYTTQALKKYGLARGVQKSIVRICKCHPFSKGGIDLP